MRFEDKLLKLIRRAILDGTTYDEIFEAMAVCQDTLAVPYEAELVMRPPRRRRVSG